MTKKADLQGRQFGRLTVLREHPVRKRSKVHWECQCECGALKIVASDGLLHHGTQSCGCLQREITAARSLTHGHALQGAPSPTYMSWKSMLARCLNQKHDAYPDYGGRGISVCERWQDFENFLTDMGARPAGMTLDRTDNSGNYEPGNCAWATRTEQSRNRRGVVRIECRGRRLTLLEWSNETGLTVETIRQRLKRGRSPERALAVRGERIEVSCNDVGATGYEKHEPV